MAKKIIEQPPTTPKKPISGANYGLSGYGAYTSDEVMPTPVVKKNDEGK